MKKGANYRDHFFIFLISPILGLVLAIKNFRLSYAKNIVWLFFIFYGFIMIYNVRGSDIEQYAKWFIEISKRNIDFSNGFGFSFGDEDETLDLFRSVTLILISRFTSNPSVYFAFIGAIYGFFYSRVMSFVANRISVTHDYYKTLFFFTFVFIIPFYDVQFIRFSTATIVFLFFALPYFYEGKSRNIFYCTITLLIHFAFLFPVLLLLAYHFMPKSLTAFFYFFVISIFFAEIKLGAVTGFLQENLPLAMQGKISTYTNEDYVVNVQNFASKTNWYIKYRQTIISYLNYSFIFYLFFLYKKNIEASKGLYKAFCFVLLIYGLSNIISIIPSGGRFIALSQKFLWVFLSICLFSKEGKGVKVSPLFMLLSIPVFILYTLTGFRYATDTFGISMLIGNPISAFFLNDDKPIIEFLR